MRVDKFIEQGTDNIRKYVIMETLHITLLVFLFSMPAFLYVVFVRKIPTAILLKHSNGAKLNNIQNSS